MNTQKFSFSEWLASRKAVSFALAIGVLFLFTNYSGVLNNANPDAGQYRYPEWLIFFLSHVDSFFFGLVTAILLFQASKEWQKLLYCGFESVLIFLNLNRTFITEFAGIDSRFFLASYIAVFSGVSFYFLGSLAKLHRVQVSMDDLSPTLSNPDFSESLKKGFPVTDDDIREEEKTLKEAQEILSKSESVKAPKGFARMKKMFDAGLSVNEASKRTGVSWQTAKKAKDFYEKKCEV